MEGRPGGGKMEVGKVMAVVHWRMQRHDERLAGRRRRRRRRRWWWWRTGGVERREESERAVVEVVMMTVVWPAWLCMQERDDFACCWSSSRHC